MKIEIRKYMKFVLSGGLSALTSLVLFYVFITYLNVWYLLASTLSFVTSVVVGYYLQKYITFKDSPKGNEKREILLFFFFSGINLLINIGLMSFFVEICSFNKMLAKVCTLSILACWNYFVYEKLVFVKKNIKNIPLG